MSKHLTAEIPEIIHTGQRVLRTIIQTGIPAFLAFAVVLPQVIDALGLPVTSRVYLWLVGLAGIVTGIAAALTRIMAIPTINRWLTTIGLGTIKKTDPQTPANPTQDPTTTPPANP
jgi:predicted aspartyl protease